LFCSACSAKSTNTSIKQNCKVNFSNLDGLPGSVLVGTDVDALSSFKLSSQDIAGSYTSNMGGATVDLSISQSLENKSLTREFQEPGDTQKVHEYNPICELNGFISAENLKGLMVEGGVLLLELNSNTDGIPNDLWVFYKAIK
jgi:hypothetical protein